MEGYIKQKPEKVTINRIDNAEEVLKIEIIPNSINIITNKLEPKSQDR